MDIRVLGPVDAFDGGEPLNLGGRRPRTIVAALTLAGEPVSLDRLIEEVWRDQPPRSAVGTLQSYLSRLRRVLGSERLTNGGRSYALVGDASTFDVDRFRDRVVDARSAASAGELDRAAQDYRVALATWRGEVAEGIDGGPLVREAAARLAEERLIAIEEQVDVALAAGRHRDVIPDLDALTTANPHRERLHGQRMLALYRSGRQVDALVGFQVARKRLVEGLGIEPGPGLQVLQQRILAQDPGLELLARGAFDALDDGLERLGAAHGRPVASDSDDVAPRRSDAGRMSSLPAPLDTFVGRTAELAEIAALLADTRLLSLVGAGGCGKTQLALRVASDVQADYPGGVWWVELGALRDPQFVERAVGTSLGVPEPTDGSWRDAVLDRLSDATPLLVLDNCEHLVEACAELVATILRHCPSVHVLTTSRQPLDVAGERAWRVPSLAVPPADASPSAVLASEAAQLLALRATAARPGFELSDEDPRVVAQICRELDGIPLALELAAARLAVLSVEELAERLEDRFRVLTGGRRSAPARHRTLEAAIGWSFDLLDDQERILLSRLSVFAGGFTLRDVEAVCAAAPLEPVEVLDVVTALVDRSLVQRVRAPTAPARHDLLATVASFAGARLDGDEQASLRARHADHYADIAAQARPRLTSFGQVEALNRLHAEQDNLRQVIELGGEPAARVVASAWVFWLEFGHAREGDRWIRDILRAPATEDPELLLQLEEGAARLASAVGDADRARQHLASAEAHAERLGDRSALVRCAALRASQAARAGELRAATMVIDAAASLADAEVGAWSAASLEHHGAGVAARCGDLDRAATAYHIAEVGFQEVGDEWGACLARLGAARIARRAGDLAAAVHHHRTNLMRGLDLTVSTLDFIGLPQDLHGLALIASETDEHELAVMLLGSATTLRTAVELAEFDDERADRRDAWDRAVGHLGDHVARAAYEHGRASSAEHAVQLALDRTVTLADGSSPAAVVHSRPPSAAGEARP